MEDTVTTINQLKKRARTFVDERNWQQFHSLKNLSMNISIEASELMELFLWVDLGESHSVLHKRRADVEDELADVLLGVLCFANAAHIDLVSAFERKMKENEAKYPADLVSGKSDKYTTYCK